MSRLLDDLRAVVLACLPTSPFWVPRRFRVIEMASDNRVKLQAVVKALGLPNVLPVSMSPGMAGVWAKLTPGVLVIVQFVDGDPSMPLITHFEGPDGAGFLPVEATIDAVSVVAIGPTASTVELGSGADVVADPTGRFVRWGDSVVFPGPGIAVLAAAPGTATAKVESP